MGDDERLKPVFWVGSARDDLKCFPEDVQRSVGYALFRAQQGSKAPEVKPLSGIVRGAGVHHEEFGSDP